MKIQLLDYLGNKHYIKLPKNTDKVVINIISGDSVMVYPFIYDTDTESARTIDFHDGTVIIERKDFAKLNKIKKSIQLLSFENIK